MDAPRQTFYGGKLWGFGDIAISLLCSVVAVYLLVNSNPENMMLYVFIAIIVVSQYVFLRQARVVRIIDPQTLEFRRLFQSTIVPISELSAIRPTSLGLQVAFHSGQSVVHMPRKIDHLSVLLDYLKARNPAIEIEDL